MKGNRLVHRIGGFVLAALLLSSVAIMSGGTAQAQRRGRVAFRGGIGVRVGAVRPIRPFYGYPYGYYNQFVFSSSQSADNQGYKDGLKTGADDARHGKSNDPERSHYFQNAGFGNFGETYRQGFLRGYSEGFAG
jgi:hypothetical protein